MSNEIENFQPAVDNLFGADKPPINVRAVVPTLTEWEGGMGDNEFLYSEAEAVNLEKIAADARRRSDERQRQARETRERWMNVGRTIFSRRGVGLMVEYARQRIGDFSHE